MQIPWQAHIEDEVSVRSSLLSILQALDEGFPGGSAQQLRNHLPKQVTPEMRPPSLGQEDSLEKEMATHSTVLAWGIP